MLTPKLVIGVRHPFRSGACTAPSGRAAGSANWGSDPKNQLPPAGAAAPADWQSQIRGPCLKESAHRAAEGFPVRGLLIDHEKLVS